MSYDDKVIRWVCVPLESTPEFLGVCFVKPATILIRRQLTPPKELYYRVARGRAAQLSSAKAIRQKRAW